MVKMLVDEIVVLDDDHLFLLIELVVALIVELTVGLNEFAAYPFLALYFEMVVQLGHCYT
jgi:hypothetical protein